MSVDINLITSQGYIVEKLDPNIYLIKDFLTENDLNKLWSIINDSVDSDWAAQLHYTKHLEDRAEELTGKRDIKEAGIEVTKDWDDKVLSLGGKTDLVQELSKRVSSFFEKDCGFDFRSFGTLQRMYNGTELKAHYDDRADIRHVWAAVAYINDDYKGGEIYFSKKSISLTPKKGSLLVFPATEEYEHGVKVVKDGPIRYVLPSFIFDHSRVNK
jgi:hypothetical protein